MRKLIITADDYGMSKEVNEAIEKCVEAKVVLSTNVMANMKYCSVASELKKKFPYLSVGIHYNFTVGKPVLPAEEVPTLVNNKGEFLSYNEVRQACKVGKYNHDQVRAEMAAQYQRYVEICGEPDYWNTHENVHVYPDLYPVFRDLSLKLGIKRMRSHERIYVPSSTGASDKSLNWKLTNPIKKILLKSWQNKSRSLGIISPDGILVRMNEIDKLNLEYLFANINWKNNSSAEIAIHPSVSAQGEYFGAITEDRVREYQVFSNASVVKLAADNGIELSSFEF